MGCNWISHRISADPARHQSADLCQSQRQRTRTGTTTRTPSLYHHWDLIEYLSFCNQQHGIRYTPIIPMVVINMWETTKTLDSWLGCFWTNPHFNSWKMMEVGIRPDALYSLMEVIPSALLGRLSGNLCGFPPTFFNFLLSSLQPRPVFQ